MPERDAGFGCPPEVVAVVFCSDRRYPRPKRRCPLLRHDGPALAPIETGRGLLVGTAGGFTAADDALGTFRRYYPGGPDDIEQAFVIDWARDPWAMACEPVSYGPGQLRRFWPRVIEPEGRVHFVGAYADNLNWGMEAATRSAHRVAAAIDAA